MPATWSNSCQQRHQQRRQAKAKWLPLVTTQSPAHRREESAASADTHSPTGTAVGDHARRRRRWTPVRRYDHHTRRPSPLAMPSARAVNEAGLMRVAWRAGRRCCRPGLSLDVLPALQRRGAYSVLSIDKWSVQSAHRVTIKSIFSKNFEKHKNCKTIK